MTDTRRLNLRSGQQVAGMAFIFSKRSHQKERDQEDDRKILEEDTDDIKVSIHAANRSHMTDLPR